MPTSTCSGALTRRQETALTDRNRSPAKDAKQRHQMGLSTPTRVLPGTNTGRRRPCGTSTTPRQAEQGRCARRLRRVPNMALHANVPRCVQLSVDQDTATLESKSLKESAQHFTERCAVLEKHPTYRHRCCGCGRRKKALTLLVTDPVERGDGRTARAPEAGHTAMICFLKTVRLFG